jgi:hypothetical protein
MTIAGEHTPVTTKPGICRVDDPVGSSSSNILLPGKLG